MRKVGIRNRNFAVKASRVLALSIVLALAGCASKATKESSSALSANGRGMHDAGRSNHGGDSVDPLARAVEDAESLAGYSSIGEAASAYPNSGVMGSPSLGYSGAWGHDEAFGVAGDALEGGAGTAGVYGEYGRDDTTGLSDWERALSADLDLTNSSPEQLAERVAAARRHALNIAREDEDPTLYSALTGGRDLYADMATERALAANEFGMGERGADYAQDPNRDYQRRGFFDEEANAFAPGMTQAERIAARVEAARRHAGLTDSDDEMVAAFQYGPYSRIYDRDSDVSGLIALDDSGRLSGWAAPGEVAADGSVFAQGGSQRMLSDLRGSPGANSGSQYADGAGGKKGRERRGAVDVAAARALVNEDMEPQTLGGALPMVLGVDENGQFDFDAYLLRDEVKSKLDGLAEKLQDAEFDRLDVVGHSDRIGDANYNKSLSHRRALAVAQYLRDRGVPEYKIKVRGLGDAMPVTKLEECEGLRGDDMIACLQPDRRVEIAASIRRMAVDVQ